MKRKMVSTSTVARDPNTARHASLAAANAAAASAAAGSLHPPPPQFMRLLDHGGVTVARTPPCHGVAALPLRTARPPDLGWIEAAAAAAARPFSAGSRPPGEPADSSSSSAATRLSSAGSRPLLEAADSSSAATRPRPRPSTAAGFRPIPSFYAAPSVSGPPTAVPLPDLHTMVDELEKDMSRMRYDLSVTVDKANRKLASVEALHEFQKTKELAMEKKMDFLNGKIVELEGVIKLMQAEDSSIEDRCKGKHAAMQSGQETDLPTKLNHLFKTLDVMISAIEHAWQCNAQHCAQQYCRDFKVLILHVSKCRKQPKETDCAICKHLLPLLSFHASECTTKACTLLFCQGKGQVRNHFSVDGSSGCKNQ